MTSNMDELRDEMMSSIIKMTRINIGAFFSDATKLESFVLSTVARLASESGTPRVKLSDIIRALNIAPPAVSRALRILERKGYIKRKIDDADRRVIIVELTDAGADLCEKAESTLKLFFTRVSQRMGEEKMKLFFSLTEEMLAVSDEEMKQIISETGDNT